MLRQGLPSPRRKKAPATRIRLFVITGDKSMN
jgi:hypothetical protein